MIKTAIRLIFIFLLSFRTYAFEWPMYCGNPERTSQSGIELKNMKLAWKFSLGKHIWHYYKMTGVFSSSAVFAEINGIPMVFFGSYDHNIYSLNALTGKKLWEYSTGGPIDTAPVIFHNGNKVCIIVESGDRTLYSINALDGKLIWQKEIFPWSFTVFNAKATSPLLIRVDGSDYLFGTLYFSDAKAFRNKQTGVVFKADPKDGRIVWKKELSKSFLYSPAATKINGKYRLFITSEDGNTTCLEPVNGEVIWKKPFSMSISSYPLIMDFKGRKILFFGSEFGPLEALDVSDGSNFWKYKLGFISRSPGAVSEDNSSLFVPNYDRFLYSFIINHKKPKLLWRFYTKKYIGSAPLSIRFKGENAVLIPSMDNYLYLIDSKGKELAKFSLGKRLWEYEKRGDTLWSSPSPIIVNGISGVVLPWYDGNVYCFFDHFPFTNNSIAL